MEFIITYKVRFIGSEGNTKVIAHTTKVTAQNAIDGLFRAFEGCPQHTRQRIFDISIAEK